MPEIHRYNDSNDGGGIIRVIPQDFVYEDGKLVSVDGSTGTTHDDEFEHSEGIWKTANGSDFVLIAGKGVNRKGDADTCGHARIDGSDFVFVD